jgi:hypothetical protein
MTKNNDYTFEILHYHLIDIETNVIYTSDQTIVLHLHLYKNVLRFSFITCARFVPPPFSVLKCQK